MRDSTALGEPFALVVGGNRRRRSGEDHQLDQCLELGLVEGLDGGDVAAHDHAPLLNLDVLLLELGLADLAMHAEALLAVDLGRLTTFLLRAVLRLSLFLGRLLALALVPLLLERGNRLVRLLVDRGLARGPVALLAVDVGRAGLGLVLPARSSAPRQASHSSGLAQLLTEAAKTQVSTTREAPAKARRRTLKSTMGGRGSPPTGPPGAKEPWHRTGAGAQRARVASSTRVSCPVARIARLERRGLTVCGGLVALLGERLDAQRRGLGSQLPSGEPGPVRRELRERRIDVAARERAGGRVDGGDLVRERTGSRGREGSVASRGSARSQDGTRGPVGRGVEPPGAAPADADAAACNSAWLGPSADEARDPYAGCVSPDGDCADAGSVAGGVTTDGLETSRGVAWVVDPVSV